MQEGLISICALAYKHESFVLQFIDGVKNQKYKNFEIIILDDGSSDGTVRAIQDAIKDVPQKCTVLTQKNTGNVGYNFNKLLSHAVGEFVYITSVDDVLKPDSLERMIAILQEDKNIQFCAADRAELIDNEGNLIGKLTRSPFYGKSHNNVSVEDLFKSEIEIAGSFYVQSCLFRKSIIDAVGGFDEDMTGDDIVLRTKIFIHMLKHPEMCFKIINDSVFLYRKHENNLHKNVIRQVDTIYQIQERYGNGLKCNHILPWSMHGVEKCFEELDKFVLHKGNIEHRNYIIQHIFAHYNELLTEPNPNYQPPIKFKDVKRYCKQKIKKFFKK